MKNHLAPLICALFLFGATNAWSWDLLFKHTPAKNYTLQSVLFGSDKVLIKNDNVTLVDMLFEKFDQEKTGYLDIDKLAEVMSKRYVFGMPSKTNRFEIIAQSLRLIDLDGDGRISREDAEKAQDEVLNKQITRNHPICRQMWKKAEPCSRNAGFSFRQYAVTFRRSDLDALYKACQYGITQLTDHVTEKCILSDDLEGFDILPSDYENQCFHVKTCMSRQFKRTRDEMKQRDVEDATKYFTPIKYWSGATTIVLTFLGLLMGFPPTDFMCAFTGLVLSIVLFANWAPSGLTWHWDRELKKIDSYMRDPLLLNGTITAPLTPNENRI